MKENWHTEYQGDLVVNKLQLRSIEHFKIPFFGNKLLSYNKKN